MTYPWLGPRHGASKAASGKLKKSSSHELSRGAAWCGSRNLQKARRFFGRAVGRYRTAGFYGWCQWHVWNNHLQIVIDDYVINYQVIDLHRFCYSLQTGVKIAHFYLDVFTVFTILTFHSDLELPVGWCHHERCCSRDGFLNVIIRCCSNVTHPLYQNIEHISPELGYLQFLHVLWAIFCFTPSLPPDMYLCNFKLGFPRYMDALATCNDIIQASELTWWIVSREATAVSKTVASVAKHVRFTNHLLVCKFSCFS